MTVSGSTAAAARPGPAALPATVAALDTERLTVELARYHRSLDAACDEAYAVAEAARARGLDFVDHVEIPRAADLAGRTEKLLEEYLEGLEVADQIRSMLADKDRETTAIEMARWSARATRERGHGTLKVVDTGLRVGLAILTEAVLVAPLEGIGQVRLLRNPDGSEFVSVDFCGPIRAAGGTAQALAVLIADMIRRELGLARYTPTDAEVERVKEEFALYRGNLQYRPPPAEVEGIVRACPVMVNGEGTEEIEVAGYRDLPNVDDNRVRGGVLLVIGEGLCLKAPKIQKHTERLKVPGWGFIGELANRGKSKSAGEEGPRRRSITPVTKFMQDIIAGRPVFGDPLEPGGFRLRYGRARPSGLAAGSMHPAAMAAMDDFIAVGTQIKIERPGKAAAITPCGEADGPTVLLDDGSFGRVDDLRAWRTIQDKVVMIWDNGELVLGFGEFLENNKTLVPAAYNSDWWASDLLAEVEALDQRAALLKALGRDDAPPGLPASGVIPGERLTPWQRAAGRRRWHTWLRGLRPDWWAMRRTALHFGTAVSQPHGLWWADLPLEWVDLLLIALTAARVEPVEGGETGWQGGGAGRLVLPGAVRGWTRLRLEPVERGDAPPGPALDLPPPLTDERRAGVEHVAVHGVLKAAVMTLGCSHHHEGDDLVIDCGWEALLDGLGFMVPLPEEVNDGPLTPRRRQDARVPLDQRVADIRAAREVILAEERRQAELGERRREVRIRAETEARQRGLGIADTDAAGKEAEATVRDPGPADRIAHEAALKLLDDHAVDGGLWLVRQVSELRWEHTAPVRIGCRMARPEKAAHREMKPPVHALVPIATMGGPQRLLEAASQQREVRVQVGVRRCTTCDRSSPFLRCHHPSETGRGRCDGRTDHLGQREFQTLPIAELAEATRQDLGLDRLPPRVKCVKGLMSAERTPEPLAKGVLRAKHQLPTFRDGTVRFDMSDIPVTHVHPSEMGAPWERLVDLGYTHDIDGIPLTGPDQLIELLPQDVIASTKAVDHLVRTAAYIDDLLVRWYDLPPFYEVAGAEDLLGTLLMGLAPHTSGGVLCRLVGWTDAQGCYAHPLFHAAKRRNCDGDEDSIMLLLDGLLNFSKLILPSNRGGRMDAPLVLTTRLNPTEIDKEALNVDAAWFYPRAFYQATQDQPEPKTLLDRMDIVEQRLGSIGAVRGYGYTHGTTRYDEGPAISAYKTLKRMVDKMEGQLELGRKLRAVDVRNVASAVVEGHFLRDLRGNLMAFTRQKVRCIVCGHSYRRIPLAGQCIRPKRGRRGTFAGGGSEEVDLCGGKLALTVTEGAVRKYVEVTQHVVEAYGVRQYTAQRVDLLERSIDALFENDKVTVFTLDDFL